MPMASGFWAILPSWEATLPGVFLKIVWQSIDIDYLFGNQHDAVAGYRTTSH
jgi:hypothetical protein